jgi:LPXTG-motif cell wall-anchored protein
MMLRRFSAVGALCALLVLLGTGQAAHAKTCMCANDATAETAHDTPVDIPLNVAADYGPVREIKIDSGPAHGTATASVPVDSDGVIHYVPDPGYFGTDVLTYIATVGYDDGNTSQMNTATVTITVTAPDPTTTTTTTTTTTLRPTTTTTVAAAGTTVLATTAPTTMTVVAAATLPRTGSTSGGLIALGAAAVVSGSGVLALSRRRFGRIRT